MARKKGEEEKGGNWMDTYGDMVTLLLTFFIVLYSMSSIKEDKWAELVRAFNKNGTTKVDQIVLTMGEDGDEPGYNKGDIEDPTDLDKLFQTIQDFIDENGMSDKVTVSKTEEPDEEEKKGPRDDNIFMEFQDYIAFEPDTAVLTKDSYKVLDFLGEAIKEVDSEVAIVLIQGHTASFESSVVDSRLLSTERAGVISNYFEEKFGINPKKLAPMGWADLYPVSENDTEEGRAKNRRVSISIIGKDSELIKDSDFLRALGIEIGDKYVVDKVNEKDNTESGS